MKKLLSLFLACILLLGILPTSVFAADSVEEALGEVNIYNGDYELGYLSINGAVKKQTYTYFLYESNDTPVQPQPQAVGAARRDPRRGEIPVTRARAVQACRLRLGK